MPANEAVIAALQVALSGELAANPQYQIHAVSFRVSGFLGLADATDDRGDDEHRHAALAISRLLDLGAVPSATVGKVDVAPGDPQTSIALDFSAEERAESDWAKVAASARDAGDATTERMALEIRAEESEHLRELRGWKRQIELTGAENFLSAHTPSIKEG